ncbi:hypothetical protein OH492_09230 [Vibrio chagasii]|nr:hypothetical protein [Vibrio chagasii]
MKGVADAPYGGDEEWHGELPLQTLCKWCANDDSRRQNGISFAELDFTVLSGEKAGNLTPRHALPDDGSESITVILSGILTA